MLKKTVILVLISLHLLTQSAIAFEFQPVLIPPAIQANISLREGYQLPEANKLLETPYRVQAGTFANELTSLSSEIVGFASLNRAFTHDNVGNRLSKAEDIQIPPGGTSYPFTNFNYGYNDIYELTTVSGSQAHNFVYDNVGNRTNADGLAIGHNNLNQYTTAGPLTLTHDSQGNTTSDGINTYTYDEENRLLTANSLLLNASYTYDAFNRRVSKTVGGVTKYFVYDADNIIEERQLNGVVNKLFLHGPQADEHLMYFNASTGGLYFYYADETNSTSLLLDPAGTPVEFYTYDVYGAPSVINSVVDNPYMFTGREWDSETGTYYYRARQYSPLLGRFLQRDPIGYYDSMNLYQYTFNSPNNFIDPSGEVAIAIPWVIWQAVEIGLTLWTALEAYQLMDDIPSLNSPFQFQKDTKGENQGEESDEQSTCPTGKEFTPDQTALQDLVDQVTNGGRKPLSRDDLDTVKDWANETNYPGYREDLNGHSDTQWSGPHIHIPGAGRGGHIPVE